MKLKVIFGKSDKRFLPLGKLMKVQKCYGPTITDGKPYNEEKYIWPLKEIKLQQLVKNKKKLKLFESFLF